MLYIKALHIIFVITWFAGLFYIVRLFVYYSEAQQYNREQRDILQAQYRIMQRRLWYGITWPSAICTLILGLSLLSYYTFYPTWLLLKLVWVFFLFGYHVCCHLIFKQQQKDINKYTSGQLRVWNEVATVFLFAIIFLVILKDLLPFVYGFLGLMAFSLLLFLAIRIYKKSRARS